MAKGALFWRLGDQNSSDSRTYRAFIIDLAVAAAPSAVPIAECAGFWGIMDRRLDFFTDFHHSLLTSNKCRLLITTLNRLD
jgi:hypothetical protein